MPDVTSVVACSGLNGLIVVLARLNLKSPASATAPPTRAMAMNTAPRTASGNSNEGPEREASHIAAPITNATTGGGIFSSSALIGAFARPKTSASSRHRAAKRRVDRKQAKLAYGGQLERAVGRWRKSSQRTQRRVRTSEIANIFQPVGVLVHA